MSIILLHKVDPYNQEWLVNSDDIHQAFLRPGDYTTVVLHGSSWDYRVLETPHQILAAVQQASADGSH